MSLFSHAPQTDTLSVEGIRSFLPDDLAALFDIDLYQCVSSTNEVIKECVLPAHVPYKVVVAHEQNAGRGRRGKMFFSPKNSGVYISIACALNNPEQGLDGLTAKAGLAVCSAVKTCTKLNPKIKWVNDIYVDSKKVCGILCETKTHAGDNKMREVIIGIGINVYQPSKVPDTLKEKIGYLSNTYVAGLRNRLIASLLMYLHAELTNNSKRYITRYKKLSLLDGREVLVKVGASHAQHARVLGIDDMLQLQVQYDSGHVATLISSEVSIEFLS